MLKTVQTRLKNCSFVQLELQFFSKLGMRNARTFFIKTILHFPLILSFCTKMVVLVCKRPQTVYDLYQSPINLIKHYWQFYDSFFSIFHDDLRYSCLEGWVASKSILIISSFLLLQSCSQEFIQELERSKYDHIFWHIKVELHLGDIYGGR